MAKISSADTNDRLLLRERGRLINAIRAYSIFGVVTILAFLALVLSYWMMWDAGTID